MNLSEISDRAVRRIDMAPFRRLITPNLKRLVTLIESYGFKVRIVGGAVRDVLIGHPPRDIDLNTNALPDQIMYILEKHDLSYITKGIPHGTVKVRFSPDEEYEITSLAYEIEDKCCPEKIVVHSSHSWSGDAKRRDFTIDTLSLDFDGHLYDYVGGMSDLRNQFIRFLGDPAERIKKDPILILRFFKLLSLFPNPKYDTNVIPTIQANMRRIKRLKPKRIALELSNIRAGTNANKVLKMMDSLGIAEYMEDLHSVTEHIRQIERVNAVRWLLEAAPLHIIPALRIFYPDGQRKVVVGQRGDMHADIFDRLDPNVHKDAINIDSGFYDTRADRYLTRSEALAAVGYGESNALRQAQRPGVYAK